MWTLKLQTQTQKKIDNVTIRQVAKMLHAEHAEAVLSKKRQTSTRNKRMSRAQTPKAFSEAEMHCAITFNWSEARRDLASHSRGGPVTIHVDVSMFTQWCLCNLAIATSAAQPALVVHVNYRDCDSDQKHRVSVNFFKCWRLERERQLKRAHARGHALAARTRGWRILY